MATIYSWRADGGYSGIGGALNEEAEWRSRLERDGHAITERSSLRSYREGRRCHDPARMCEQRPETRGQAAVDMAGYYENDPGLLGDNADRWLQMLHEEQEARA